MDSLLIQQIFTHTVRNKKKNPEVFIPRRSLFLSRWWIFLLVLLTQIKSVHIQESLFHDWVIGSFDICFVHRDQEKRNKNRKIGLRNWRIIVSIKICFREIWYNFKAYRRILEIVGIFSPECVGISDRIFILVSFFVFVAVKNARLCCGFIYLFKFRM